MCHLCPQLKDRIDELEEEVRQLRETAGITLPEFGLTDSEWQIIGPLFKRHRAGQEPAISHDQIHTLYKPRQADADDTDPHTIKVLVSRARKKLKPYGWEIQPIYGKGYTLVRTPGFKSNACNQNAA